MILMNHLLFLFILIQILINVSQNVLQTILFIMGIQAIMNAKIQIIVKVIPVIINIIQMEHVLPFKPVKIMMKKFI